MIKKDMGLLDPEYIQKCFKSTLLSFPESLTISRDQDIGGLFLSKLGQDQDIRFLDFDDESDFLDIEDS